MAAYSIGAGKTYTTVTAFEADLDNLSASEDVVGEMYNEAYNEKVTLNGGGTVGLNSITIRPASGEEHDGTEGTGPRMVASAFGYLLNSTTPINLTVQGIELDGADTSAAGGLYHAHATSSLTCDRVISHNYTGTGGTRPPIKLNCDGTIMNSIVYSHTGVTGIMPIGAYTQDVLNNTVWGCANGIAAPYSSATTTLKNNLCCGNTTNDFDGTVSNWDTTATNMSSDATSPETGLRNVTTANQFQNLSVIDLHLKSGADAIGAGTDLVTTPSGIQFDIDGYDRDTAVVDWDIGADQYVAAGDGGPADGLRTLSLTGVGV